MRLFISYRSVTIIRRAIQPRTFLSLFIFLLLTACFPPLNSFRAAAQEAIPPSNPMQPVVSNTESLPDCEALPVNSPYIPLDSWVYPAVTRLFALGYASDVYLGLRPWTLTSVCYYLEISRSEIDDAELYGEPTAEQAEKILSALVREIERSGSRELPPNSVRLHVESAYSLGRGITGTPLRDSFHLGSTIVNDYGRPFASGINNYSGLSGYATLGPVLLYARGEFQGSPSAPGYSPSLAATLSAIDDIPFINPASGLPYQQQTIPLGPLGSVVHGKFLEAYASVNIRHHIISFGKQDSWLGTATGAGMAYSNNAENIYSFRINRIEGFEIPYLSRMTGPFRYDFMIGKLRGHTYVPNPAYALNPSPAVPNVINPGDPWMHVEKFSFKPTRDLEFGFERTVIWGGQGHGPITLHTFLKSFFSLNSTYYAVKDGRDDPGARFGAFDFSYRLPFPRNMLTLYTDSEAHDAPSPIAKPYHGGFRPGLYLSHFPRVPALDLRVEGVYTDSPHAGSAEGRYQYWEEIQVQGYTNNGQILGDWIGRESKGGQAWLTYHLNGNEWIQLGYRNQKAVNDFIPGGTTLNDFNFQVVKRVGKDLEINGNFTYERYKAPIYLPGAQNVTATTVQVTWFPTRKVSF